MAGRVIYTVLTGGYDRLAQPLVTNPDWDYICFTNHSGQDGVWQLRPIPFEGSPVMQARWVKMHPHELLPEYDYSVFMDANLCIAGPELYELYSFLAALEHPRRDCVWDELRYCYLMDKISTRAAVKWHGRLKKMRMPRHAGLYETGILARDHHHPRIVALDQLWWQYLLDSGGSRDQLAFTPALHQLGMTASLILGPGVDVREVSCVRYVPHVAQAPLNEPGKLNWANVKYNLRLLWRKAVLLCLK